MTELLRIGDRLFRPITADSGTTPETELEKLRRIMRAKYGTQLEAAKAWGIGKNYVSSIAIGRRRIPDFVKEDLGL